MSLEMRASGKVIEMMPGYMTEGLDIHPWTWWLHSTESIYQLACPPSTQVSESALLIRG